MVDSLAELVERIGELVAREADRRRLRAAVHVRPGRSSSSYLVESGSTRIVLDLGAGSFPETWRYASFGEIAAVFISHMHADHNVDLIPLRHWVKYVNRGYGPALYGPARASRADGRVPGRPGFSVRPCGRAAGAADVCGRRPASHRGTRDPHPRLVRLSHLCRDRRRCRALSIPATVALRTISCL